MHDLDLPRGEERELAVDRDRVYELNGDDSRTLAALGTFRVVPEQELDTCQDTLRHLRDEGLVETVDLGNEDRNLTLTKEGRDLLDSHTVERDGDAAQAFHAGVSRPREVDHDANLYATFRQEEARLRDEHGDPEIRRVILEERAQFRVQLFIRAALSKKGVEAVYDSREQRHCAPHEFTIRLAARPAGRRGSHGGRACTKQASPPGRISLIPR